MEALIDYTKYEPGMKLCEKYSLAVCPVCGKVGEYRPRRNKRVIASYVHSATIQVFYQGAKRRSRVVPGTVCDFTTERYYAAQEAAEKASAADS
jgi:hypothetical protein